MTEVTGSNPQMVEFIPTGKKHHPLSYATKLSSGIDLRAALGKNKSVTIYPNQHVLIETGYSCKLDPSVEGQIRSRSGLALKFGIIVLNAPGTIDADYEGPVSVILQNVSVDPFVVYDGDRIAQFVLCPVLREQAYMQAEPIERGEGGFGSTGVN